MTELTPFERYQTKYCNDCHKLKCRGKCGKPEEIEDQIYKCSWIRKCNELESKGD